jgi:hypothetical protein
MKIQTEEHGWNVYDGVVWTAIDSGSYDGADDAHSPVGWGNSERDAVDDLVEQIVEDLEEQIDRLQHHLNPEPAETCSPAPRPDLGEAQPISGQRTWGIKPVAGLLDGLLQSDGNNYPDLEDLECRCQRRLPDEEFYEQETD